MVLYRRDEDNEDFICYGENVQHLQTCRLSNTIFVKTAGFEVAGHHLLSDILLFFLHMAGNFQHFSLLRAFKG